MVDITQDEAQHSLAQVQEAMKRMRNSVAEETSSYLILWGLVWLCAFLGTHFFPKFASWTWLVLDLVGIIGSVWIGRTGGQRVKRSDTRQIFFFWLLLFLYLFLWLILLNPRNYEQASAFLCTGIMFAYVILGLLFFERVLLWLGLAVTGLIFLGYGLFLYTGFSWFWLWMAITGGGSLAGMGFYIRYRWR